jgi:hypothetical protein
MHTDEDTQEKKKSTGDKPPKEKPKASRNPWRIAAFAVVFVIVAIVAYGTYIFAASPAPIRKPVFQHYHFRMQVLVDGRAVNFGQKKYQIPLGQDACSANLAEQPIHFHDNKDQMTHIHWDGITGGMVLKYYGWDYIGGVNGALGYRFDKLPKPQKVPIMGNLLPAAPKDAQMYVYTGQAGNYQEHAQEDFLQRDLEDFFGKKSNLPVDSEASLLDRLFSKAYAHGDEDHGDDNTHGTDEKLEELNNLIGDVIIFAQKDRPTPQQVNDRFDKMEPLSESTCAG